MLIYAVADIHGNPGHLEAIKKIVQREKPDVLIAAGDLASHMGKGAQDVMQALSALGLPVFVIKGNTDGKSIQELAAKTPRVEDLHLKTAMLEGATFVGAGGTVPIPFRSKLALFEKGVVSRLDNLLTPGCVMVVHPPPYGVTDKVLGKFNAGSKSVASLIKKREPAVCICGHIHENAGTAMAGKTLVVNCAMSRSSAGALIQLAKGKAPECQMLAP